MLMRRVSKEAKELSLQYSCSSVVRCSLGPSLRKVIVIVKECKTEFMQLLF